MEGAVGNDGSGGSGCLGWTSPTPHEHLLLLALFLWACGFHFSSTTAGGDRGWLEAMLFSLSAAGTKGMVCDPEV